MNEESIEKLFADLDGILVAPGFGQRGIKGKILTVKYARENKVPFLTQSKLEEQGAHFVAQDDFTSHLEEDSKFISGQNPQSSKVVGKAILNALQ